MSSSSLQTLISKRNTVVQDITRLQQVEEELYRQLANITGDSSEAQSQRNVILAKIEELRLIRANMYDLFKSEADSATVQLEIGKSALDDRSTVLKLINAEKQRTEGNIDKIKSNIYNKKRLVSLSRYESSRYNRYLEILKVEMILLVIIVILALLVRSKFLPSFIGFGFIILLASGMVIYGFTQINDLLQRNDFDFDKYDFTHDPSFTKDAKVYNDAGQQSANSSGNCENQ